MPNEIGARAIVTELLLYHNFTLIFLTLIFDIVML